MLDGLRENFEIILLILLFISTVCYVIYRMTMHRNIKADLRQSKSTLIGLKRKERKKARHNIIARRIDNPVKKVIYFFADLFWILLFVVVVRSFLYEPFVIPSGSMKPGLQVGDVVVVNKYELGLRVPVVNLKFTPGKDIKRGDVLVFKYPNNPDISYIKRVVGLPGDKIYYDNRNMIINGQPVAMTLVKQLVDEVELQTGQGVIKQTRDYSIYQEDLFGYKNDIRYADRYPATYPSREWVVPKGKYLMMGDNRDNSADGRDFGFLDEKLIIGKAVRIIFNFNCFKGAGRCNRFFKSIQ